MRDAEPAELVIEDDEEVPVVTIERVVEHKVNEGASTTLRITLSQASSDTIRVNHHLFTTEVERVLATEHVDLVPIDGQVVFAPGETEKRITLTTLDDDHFDPGEFVYIEISVPEGQRVSTGRRSTRVEINDDETTRIGFESTEVTVNETDGEVVLYVVFEEDAQWEGGGLRIFIVNKTPGTATSEDFDIEFQTGTWGLDARRVEVRIAIVDDGIAEGPETFTSELTPSNEATGVFALPGSKVVEITILDDDRRELRLDTRSLAGEEGTELGYTVRLGSQPSADVTITPTLTGSRTLGIHSDTQVLTFTADNWHMPQTVRVTNPHDANDDDETATIVNAITGGDYESENVTELAVEVSVRDDEGSGVRLDNPSRNATAAGVMVNEGETKTITVRTDRVSDGTDVVDLVNTGTASSADYVLEFEGRTVRAPHRIRVPEGRRDIRVTLRIVDDGRDDEPTETIVLGSVQNGRAGVQEVRLRISPCGAQRPTAFAWLSVDGEQNTGGAKRYSEPDDPVRSPFRLRICIVEPVTGMTIPVRNRDGSIGYSTSDGRRAAISIIAIEDTHPEEARADLSEGTFSNLRERVPGQIWTTTVTATRPGRMTIDMLPRLLPLVNSPQAQWPNNEGSQFSPYVRTNRRPVIPSGPLTAMFEDLPEEHGGRPFTFAALLLRDAQGRHRRGRSFQGDQRRDRTRATRVAPLARDGEPRGGTGRLDHAQGPRKLRARARALRAARRQAARERRHRHGARARDHTGAVGEPHRELRERPGRAQWLGSVQRRRGIQRAGGARRTRPDRAHRDRHGQGDGGRAARHRTPAAGASPSTPRCTSTARSCSSPTGAAAHRARSARAAGRRCGTARR